jgi:hypothetical protein
VSPMAVAAQTGTDALTAGLTEIAAFIGGATFPPRAGTMVTMEFSPLSGTSVPGGGWPTLTKINYVEWAAVMRVWFQVRHMWEAVRYDDVDYYEDRWALDALIAAVPPEMQFSLSKKWTTKEVWDVIAVTRISSNRARKTTVQTLRKEWENLTFKLGEDVDDFALHLNTLQQKMMQFGDDTYGEERAIEKLFRCILEKYKQIAHSIESPLDLSTMLPSSPSCQGNQRHQSTICPQCAGSTTPLPCCSSGR